MIRILFLLLLSLCAVCRCYGQVGEAQDLRILFHGIVCDATTLAPLSNSRISVNRLFISLSDGDGNFAVYANRRDTIAITRLGYKRSLLIVSDTLEGKDFITGFYLESDTLKIGEVIIMPRLVNLRSSLLNAPIETKPEIENARYNLAISAYQGRTSQSQLGDPVSNYELLRQKFRVDAYEKGGIPSDRIAAISPLLLIPAAYLLLNGFPEKPPSFKTPISKQETDMIHEKYLEKLRSAAKPR